MLAVDGHGQTVAPNCIGIGKGVKIIPFDDEWSVGRPPLETSGRVHRMDNRKT
jgi:hypothetical protein